MIICSVCTGRHHPLNCVVATRHIEACLSGTPDDYRPPAPREGTVVTMFDSDAYRRRMETERKRRWLAKAAR